jgi:hypothetical protein
MGASRNCKLCDFNKSDWERCRIYIEKRLTNVRTGFKRWDDRYPIREEAQINHIDLQRDISLLHRRVGKWSHVTHELVR